MQNPAFTKKIVSPENSKNDRRNCIGVDRLPNQTDSNLLFRPVPRVGKSILAKHVFFT